MVCMRILCGLLCVLVVPADVPQAVGNASLQLPLNLTGSHALQSKLRNESDGSPAKAVQSDDLRMKLMGLVRAAHRRRVSGASPRRRGSPGSGGSGGHRRRGGTSGSAHRRRGGSSGPGGPAHRRRAGSGPAHRRRSNCKVQRERAAGPCPTKHVSSAEAQTEWLKFTPLKRVSITGKMIQDHTLGHLSKNQAIAEGKARFERDNEKNGWKNPPRTNKMSFVDEDANSLSRKVMAASDSNRVAHVHVNGGTKTQQLATQVPLSYRTVEPLKMTRGDANKYEGVHQYTMRDGTKVYIKFQAGETQKNTYLTGNYDPAGGSVEVHHWQDKRPTPQQMLPEYRVFYKNEDGELTAPVRGDP